MEQNCEGLNKLRGQINKSTIMDFIVWVYAESVDLQKTDLQHKLNAENSSI